jgi:GntR family transcriptional regulator, transcriptional repressor for pyruvate dehydrogenase complex
MVIMQNLVGPINSSERVQNITRQLQALVEGAATGSANRLPSERQLAARFQCSRNTIREALATLAAQGLIAIQGRVGAYRMPPPVTDTPPADLEQALDALRITAPALSALAAKPAAATGVTRLEAVTSNLSQALLNRDATAAYRWYVTFFLEIAILAGNSYLTKMLDEIKEGAPLLAASRLSRREQLEAFFSGVVELLQALRRGEGQDAATIAARGLDAFAGIMRTAKMPRKPALMERVP